MRQLSRRPWHGRDRELGNFAAPSYLVEAILSGLIRNERAE